MNNNKILHLLPYLQQMCFCYNWFLSGFCAQKASNEAFITESEEEIQVKQRKFMMHIISDGI